MRTHENMDLHTAQARWILALDPPEWMPAFACRLLEAGRSTPAVVEVAGLQNPTNREEAATFEQMFQELGLSSLTKREAAAIYARHVAFEIVREEVSPFDGASKMYLIWRACPEIEDLISFIYLADIYHESSESQTELDRLIRKAAEEFLSASNAWSA